MLTQEQINVLFDNSRRKRDEYAKMIEELTGKPYVPPTRPPVACKGKHARREDRIMRILAMRYNVPEWLITALSIEIRTEYDW